MPFTLGTFPKFPPGFLVEWKAPFFFGNPGKCCSILRWKFLEMKISIFGVERKALLSWGNSWKPCSIRCWKFSKIQSKFFDGMESADGVFRLTWSKGSVYLRKELNSHRIGLVHLNGRRWFVWYKNIAAVSLFWNTNMAAVTSCEALCISNFPHVIISEQNQ